ncbi:Egg cell-secreted protein 1.1 [Melia azedarach]|uniref:Egg cell-secreted protein 1.1 n=1 Tax=Melia azedarach TaxID=155640 RepID=A0ACC1XWS5_MELAZ|nr:Egg cell-secreted protein 1.1 [Melia azedarach]
MPSKFQLFFITQLTIHTEKSKRRLIMMALKNVLLILVLVCFMAYATAARNNDLKFYYKPPAYSPSESPEASGAQFIECWKALLKLNSCSKATIKYFLTGKAEISSECCSAVETSKSKCSPPGLTSLGFTSQEGDILSAYCAALTPVPAPSPA